ncbi:type VI secretion system tube protein TssD [Tenacibaculum sp. 1_MG-2023]|uniref:type VI secretion system tube protein TssD n=1 Tax=Tenacibaculum sp. 1_MG-2023 TaxID=3062653 RepID=UPI0026E39D3E|nr:type VI secretion system tube protein TssD [Tenacibaculum sp. 1_MG-2023]MDO6675060.1 type VI secretion system tube protein TssD [Tenacibaculum sp. 1_MG-2023]
MKYRTILLFNNREVEVLTYNFGFNRNINVSDQPTSSANFADLEVEIESGSNTDFEEWACKETAIDQLELKIYYPYLKGGSKTMTFFDCYLKKFETIFSSTNDQPIKDRLIITCAGVKTPNASQEYSTYWRKTLSGAQNEVTNSGDTASGGGDTNFSVTPKLS